MFGERPLLYSLAVLGLLPHWIQISLPFLDTMIMYLILVVALLVWRELSTGKLRLFLQAVALAALAIALAGIAFFIETGARNKLAPFNNLLAACTLAVLVTVVAVPKLGRKFMATPNSGVLFVGTLAFAIQALYTNVLGSFGRSAPPIWGTLGFAALLFSLGYVALEMVFANERRLQSIENELATAREIQTSILPSSSPEIKNLHISAIYHPMTAVAGDFYDFLPVDQHRVGVLVADVSGHGVPAALIAAMMKMAVKSIIACVHSPVDVLQGLNRLLSGQAPISSLPPPICLSTPRITKRAIPPRAIPRCSCHAREHCIVSKATAWFSESRLSPSIPCATLPSAPVTAFSSTPMA